MEKKTLYKIWKLLVNNQQTKQWLVASLKLKNKKQKNTPISTNLLLWKD